MKITLAQLREAVADVVREAKKKSKKKAEKDGYVARLEDGKPVKPDGFVVSREHDLSKPQGAKNVYGRQGAANFGPYTAEGALRIFVRRAIAEAIAEDAGPAIVESAFSRLKKKLASKGAASPAGLAATIGRSKYGKEGMAAKSAAGRKKKAK